jgi:hydrogen cyanide synthase HcnC
MTLMSTALSGPDIVVIGGGLVGSSIAYGLVRGGARVTLLDEGDVAFRASRGNFALVWVQSKGNGMPEYAAWTQQSARTWPTLAGHLANDTDIDVSLEQPGGFVFALSESEMEKRIEWMRRLHNQPDMVGYPYEVLDHAETKRRLPAIGPSVVGSIYCPLDGHVNSLRLFRSLHTALHRRGIDYRPHHDVEAILPEAGGFTVRGRWGEIHAPKVVLAAGLGNARLGIEVGLDVPVRPSKGQVIVTEKAKRFLDHPTVTVRQTNEGSVMVGDSQEDLGHDTVVTNPVVSLMAERAIRTFPRIADLNIVRTWSALRVMSPDGFPIYDQSALHPGAFVVTCHSGVTLAANHVLDLAGHILGGALPPELAPFSTRRFHVPSAA